MTPKLALSYGNRLLFALSVVVLVATLSYVGLLLAFGDDSHRVVYWLTFSHGTPDLLNLLAIFGPPLAMILIFSLRILHRGSILLERSLLFLAIAGITLVCSSFVKVYQTGLLDTWETLETLHHQDRVYHLAFHAFDLAESYTGYYQFYQCDRFDFFCDRLASGELDPNMRGEAHIITDASQNTISVQIDGKIVYTVVG